MVLPAGANAQPEAVGFMSLLATDQTPKGIGGARRGSTVEPEFLELPKGAHASAALIRRRDIKLPLLHEALLELHSNRVCHQVAMSITARGNLT